MGFNLLGNDTSDALFLLHRVAMFIHRGISLSSADRRDSIIKKLAIDLKELFGFVFKGSPPLGAFVGLDTAQVDITSWLHAVSG